MDPLLSRPHFDAVSPFVGKALSRFPVAAALTTRNLLDAFVADPGFGTPRVPFLTLSGGLEARAFRPGAQEDCVALQGLAETLFHEVENVTDGFQRLDGDKAMVLPGTESGSSSWRLKVASWSDPSSEAAGSYPFPRKSGTLHFTEEKSGKLVVVDRRADDHHEISMGWARPVGSGLGQRSKLQRVELGWFGAQIDYSMHFDDLAGAAELMGSETRELSRFMAEACRFVYASGQFPRLARARVELRVFLLQKEPGAGTAPWHGTMLLKNRDGEPEFPAEFLRSAYFPTSTIQLSAASAVKPRNFFQWLALRAEDKSSGKTFTDISLHVYGALGGKSPMPLKPKLHAVWDGI